MKKELQMQKTQLKKYLVFQLLTRYIFFKEG